MTNVPVKTEKGPTSISPATVPSWDKFRDEMERLFDRFSTTFEFQSARALHEIGIEHSGISKNVEQFRNDEFDLVVTVCDDANEECPIWLGKGKRVHESFTDPAKAEGTEDERLRVFREVRDEMTVKIPTLLK